jgi:hypothetical protein
MRLILSTLLFSTLAFAQLDDNTLTVTSAQNTTAAPDQLVLNVSLYLSANSTLEDALKALQGTGIAATDLTGLSASSSLVQPLNLWLFARIVSPASLADGIAALQKIRAALEVAKNGQDLVFSVSSQTSKQLLAAQSCPRDVLLADARARAATWANAAGVNLGPVLGVSNESSSQAGGGAVIADFNLAVLTLTPMSGISVPGTVLAAPTLISLSGFLPVTRVTPTCSLTVQFRLIR